MFLVMLFLGIFHHHKTKAQCITPINLTDQCVSSNQLYTISNPTAGYTYHWSIAGTGAVLTGFTGNSTNVYAQNAGSYTLTATGTGNGSNQVCTTPTVNMQSLTNVVITTNTQVGCQEVQPGFDGQPSTNTIPYNPNACLQVCEGSTVNYSAHNTISTGANATNTYSWSVIGGSISSGGSTNQVAVVWNAGIGTGSISVTITNNAGCATTKTLCIKRIESPIANFSTNLQAGNVVCQGNAVNFSDLSTPYNNSNATNSLLTYYWDFGDGTFSSLQNPTHTYNSTGNFTVILTIHNVCGCVASIAQTIKVLDGAGPSIFCNKIVCGGQYDTYTTDAKCTPYTWTVTGGQIFVNNVPVGNTYIGTNPTDNAITVQWDAYVVGGFGSVTLDGNGCNTACNNSTTISIPVIGDLFLGNIITTTVCSNQQIKIRLPAWPATNYTWSMDYSPSNSSNSSFLIQPTYNSNEINVFTGTDNAMIHINVKIENTLSGCIIITGTRFNVNGEAELTAPIKSCVQQPVTASIAATSPISNGITWTVANANNITNSIYTGAGITSVSLPASMFPTAGFYQISCTSADFCDPNAQTTQIVDKPAAPSAISGATVVCPNNSYTYTSNSIIGTTLLWSGVGSTTLPQSGNSATITWQAIPASKTLQVVSSLIDVVGCISAPTSQAINNTCTSASMSAISGCEDGISTAIVNWNCGGVGQLPPNNVVWSIIPTSAGSIQSGQGTMSATILWNHGVTSAIVKASITTCGSNFNVATTATITSGASISSVSPINSTFCSGVAQSFTAICNPLASVPSQYQWDWGDGSALTISPSSSFTNTATHTYSNFGPLPLQFTGKVRVLSACNGLASPYSTFTVNIKPQPNASLTYSGDLVYCIGGNTPTLYISSNVISTFQWQLTPTGSSLGSSTSYIVPSGGVGAYYCTATYNGCSTQVGPLLVSANNCTGNSGGGGTPCPPVCSSPPSVSAVVPVVLGCAQANATSGANCPVLSYSWSISPNTGVAAVGGSITTSPTYTFANPGIYTLHYSASFPVQGNCPPIMNGTSATLTIPLVPKMLAGLTCNSTNNGYILKLEDLSAIAPNQPTPTRVFYINGVAYSPTPATSTTFTINVSPQSNYTVYVQVSTGSGTGQTCQTTPVVITVPQLPNASIGVSTALSPALESCENQTITLSNTGSAGNVIWSWFDPNLATSVQNFSNPLIFSVDLTGNPATKTITYTLSITDANGCSASSSKTIIIDNNLLDVGNGAATPIYYNRYLISPSNPLCLGNTATISFNPTATVLGFTYPTYTTQWYQNSITNPFGTPTSGIAGAAGISTTAMQPGFYFVQVTDNKLCSNIMSQGWANVQFVSPPTVAIDGKPDVCFAPTGNSVHLNAILPALPTGVTASYQWTCSPSGAVFTGASLADNPSPGTYTYSLIVSYTGTGAICNSIVPPFVVNVHPQPSPPVLTAILASCQPYIIGINASPASIAPAVYTWSNGASGDNIVVNDGGAYRCYYTDQYGCKSSENIDIPQNPESYLWRMPTGCAVYCQDQMPKRIDGPAGVNFLQWQWPFNSAYNQHNGSYAGSGNGVCDPLWIDKDPNNGGTGNGTGTYNWGYTADVMGTPCDNMSANWNLTVNGKCCTMAMDGAEAKCDPASNNIDITVNANYISNICNGDAVYNISIVDAAGNPLGIVGIDPPSPSALSNGGVSNLFLTCSVFDINNLPSDVFIIVTAICNGEVCIGTIPLSIPCGTYTVKPKFASPNHLPLSPNHSITITPNPANTQITLALSDSLAQQLTPYSLQVFNAAGSLVKTISIADAKTNINTSTYTPGNYVLVLRNADKRKIIYIQKLAIVH